LGPDLGITCKGSSTTKRKDLVKRGLRRNAQSGHKRTSTRGKVFSKTIRTPCPPQRQKGGGKRSDEEKRRPFLKMPDSYLHHTLRRRKGDRHRARRKRSVKGEKE